MQIREFKKEKDLDYILSTFEDMFSSNKDFKFTKEGFEKFKEEILSYKGDKGKNYILEIDNKQNGYLSLCFQRGKSGVNKIIIAKLYVNKEYRKKGYARKLVDFAKIIAKEKGIKSIELNSFESNLEFYEKLGFKTIAYWMQLKL